MWSSIFLDEHVSTIIFTSGSHTLWQVSHYKSLFFLHKVHVSSSSAVPDHCRAYALSFPEDPDYVSTCDHSHVDTCDRCVRLASVVNEIEDALKEAECTNDTREELVFVASQAKQHIHSWKSHLLRSTNQDDCRLDIIKGP